ncbi:MAG: hypothetical protein KJ709_07260 [Nanoarchaeota archaeon]|nr:hypothetical protein [Nanoarchaeota archaeon]
MVELEKEGTINPSYSLNRRVVRNGLFQDIRKDLGRADDQQYVHPVHVFKILGFRSSIVQSGNSPLCAIVRYLKDSIGLRFCDIAMLICRKHNTVMTAYYRSSEQPPPQKAPVVPFSLLARLTVFEAAVFSLYNHRYSCAEISNILRKPPPSIHTVLKRALGKGPEHPEVACDVEVLRNLSGPKLEIGKIIENISSLRGYEDVD